MKLLPKSCGKCGAMWLPNENQTDYIFCWSTKEPPVEIRHLFKSYSPENYYCGYRKGNEEELNAKVCSNLGDHQCINPKGEPKNV